MSEKIKGDLVVTRDISGYNLSGTNTGDETKLSIETKLDYSFEDIYRYGFVDNTETSISFDGTNTFTLADTGGGWSYYRNGIKNTITGNKTVNLSATPPASPASYFIYIDDNIGTLTAASTTWTLEDTKVPVAIIKWNNTLTPKYWIADERHTCLIDRRMHWYEHFTSGTQFINGDAPSGFTVNNDVDADKVFLIPETTIADEDLKWTLAQFDKPNPATDTNFVVFYRTSSTSWAWRMSNMPFYYNTNEFIYWDNAGTMTQGTGGAGGNIRWYNTYLLQTNISGHARFVFISGRGNFTSLALAQAENPMTFDFTGFPIAECLIAYQFTWTTITSTSSGKCRLAAIPRRIEASVIKTVGTATTIAHNSLAGIQGGTTGEYYHATSAEYTVLQNTSGTNTGDQESSDFDHNALQNTHNLSTDIDHDGLTNTHNLTTDIDHNSLTNYSANEHIDWTNSSDNFSTTGIVKSGIEEIAVRNDTGSQLDAFKVIRTVGDYSTSAIPKVGLVASLTDRPIGVIISNLATATTGSAVKRGRVSCTGFDASGATIGDKVYSTASGALTLTPTALEIGYVLSNANPAIVYFNIGGAGGGSSLVGTYKRLGCLDIDGSTNTVDTDYGLYTVPASTYAKNVKVYICNRNGGYTARIRLAHVDGAVGDIAVEDYILFDDYLLPYETKIVELDGMVATDTLLVRSSVSLVNFEACGEELTTDVYRKRVGALDIDGATNAINTDKVVYTSDRATKVNVLICNRNSGYVAECQIAHVNSDDIADIADEDRKFFTLDVNQSLFLELDLNMAIDEIISFRSDTTNVNCLVYLAE